jgi:maltose O-acetyltransferase
MQFRRSGRNVRLGGRGDFSYSSIEIGDDVYIGPRAVFNSAISTISIGNKVLFGPDVTIMGGDHRFDIVGKYTYDITEKVPDNDRDVVIEDDVWVGARVVILKGVTIGRGSVIGAGSVVTKSIPPYSVAVGIPAKVVRSRFTPDQIVEHEALLGITDDVRI